MFFQRFFFGKIELNLLLFERAIQSFYINSRAAVSVSLQGDVLAPYLFIIVIDYVMVLSQQEFGFMYKKRTCRRSPDQVISDLDYADDIALLESSIKAATDQLKNVSNQAKHVGLEINKEKTDCIILNVQENVSGLMLDSHQIKRVEDFKYLGFKIISSEADFIHRKSLAWAAYWKLERS